MANQMTLAQREGFDAFAQILFYLTRASGFTSSLQRRSLDFEVTGLVVRVRACRPRKAIAPRRSQRLSWRMVVWSPLPEFDESGGADSRLQGGADREYGRHGLQRAVAGEVIGDLVDCVGDFVMRLEDALRLRPCRGATSDQATNDELRSDSLSSRMTVSADEDVPRRERSCAEAADLDFEATLLQSQREVEGQPDLQWAAVGVADDLEAKDLFAAGGSGVLPMCPVDVPGEPQLRARGEKPAEVGEIVLQPCSRNGPEWTLSLQSEVIAERQITELPGLVARKSATVVQWRGDGLGDGEAQLVAVELEGGGTAHGLVGAGATLVVTTGGDVQAARAVVGSGADEPAMQLSACMQGYDVPPLKVFDCGWARRVALEDGLRNAVSGGELSGSLAERDIDLECGDFDSARLMQVSAQVRLASTPFEGGPRNLRQTRGESLDLRFLAARDLYVEVRRHGCGRLRGQHVERAECGQFRQAVQVRCEPVRRQIRFVAVTINACGIQCEDLVCQLRLIQAPLREFLMKRRGRPEGPMGL